MMAQAANTTQLPFWLQLVSILLAPVSGLAGVVLGIVVKGRADGRGALRNERRDLYVSFLTSVSLAAEYLQVSRALIFQRGMGPAELAETRRLVSEVVTSRELVDLLGSPKVVSAADECFGHVLRAAKFASAPGGHRLGESEAAFSQFFDRIAASQGRLRSAATVDLGVRRADRVRRDAVVDGI